jgi:threonine dehydrogenase-like Zn-dependent dehydrogenase/sugar phosphate isomerase/epimerase
MYRCLNPGAIGVNLPWKECLPLARDHGFEGIDLPLDPSVAPAVYQDALAQHGLRVGGAGLPVNLYGDDKAFADGLAGLAAVAGCAQAVGVTRFATWILPFSDARPFKESFRFHADRLGRAARILADHGCRLGLEFIGPKTMRQGHKYAFIYALEPMLELAEAVGPNAGLLLDSWHWYTSLGTVESIRALRAEQVVYVHINDAPAGVPVEQHLDWARCLPGETGVIDLAGFLAALREIGYDGPVVPEPFVPELAKLPPAEAVGRVGAALKRVWSLPPGPAPLPQKMKAVATGRGKAWLVDLPVPRPRGNEVVVKLFASPICGSNMGAFRGDGEWVNDGHEGAGQVVAVAESQLLRVGDRVALAPPFSCGRCEHCLRGDVIFCRQGHFRGCFAQYTCVSDAVCAPMPDDVDYVHGALLGCALGPAYEATKQLAVRAFDTVVIAGLGPVGLGATALATFLGARVIGLDPEPYRRDVAARLGADLALDPTAPDIRDRIREATGGGGVAKAIECSGKEDSERLLMDLAAVRGAVAIIGENQGPIPVSPSRDFIRKGLRVIGCWHMNVLDTPDLFTFLHRAAEKADLLITHRFGFADVQKAFDTFASRKAVKVMLLPWE